MNAKTPREYLENILPNKFDPNKVHDLEIAVQMNIDGPEGGQWIVAVKDQKMTVKEGNDLSAAIAVKIKDTDFVDLVNGKLNAITAFMSGKLQMKGSMSSAMKLMDMGII